MSREAAESSQNAEGNFFSDFSIPMHNKYGISQKPKVKVHMYANKNNSSVICEVVVIITP